MMFWPGRFAGENDWPAFAYLSIWGLSRRWIRQQFGMGEGTLILAALAQQYLLHLVSDLDIDFFC